MEVIPGEIQRSEAPAISPDPHKFRRREPGRNPNGVACLKYWPPSFHLLFFVFRRRGGEAEVNP